MSEIRTYLVTGAAGFIGFHVSKRLLKDGYDVFGVDNLNDYYDPQLKSDRLEVLSAQRGFTFAEADIADRSFVSDLFRRHQFAGVVHLAAQAGVRYSIDNPHAYVDSNLVGFANVLEGCRQSQVPHLVYASSSSVYGANTRMPFSTSHNVDHPISFYAATKKANELMAHTYSHLFGLPTTGLRFFTVYGPWGRPDMAYFKFTKAILEGRTIDVYNDGEMMRDCTYVDDVVEGVVGALHRPPTGSESWSGDMPDPATSSAPYRVFNIGNHQPVKLLDFIAAIEDALGVSAQKNFLPMQPGDVRATFADVDDLAEAIGFRPTTSLQDGIARFVEWYRDYYTANVSPRWERVSSAEA